jgi:hypothetical protein
LGATVDNEVLYKPYSDCTEEEKTYREKERIKCIEEFAYFLKYVKIVSPPVPGQTGGGVVPLVLWSHLIKVINTLALKSLISIAKARQIGLSTIIAAYILWYANSHRGANILLFSKGQPEAKELLAKAKRIHEQLPPILKYKLDPDSTEEIGFKTWQSSIKAFASTPSAGISYTSSIVVCDEHAEHPYADENYLSSKPTRDAGGQFISIFTEDPFSNDNLATSIFVDALEGKNDFTPLFFPYDVRPGREGDWYEKTKRNIPERELGKLSPDLYMRKNYPRTIDEMLSLAETVVAFNKSALDSMAEFCFGQVNVGWEDLPDKYIHIYKDFHIGEFYIAGTDVSKGVGRDFSVTAILNIKTGEVVADVMGDDLKPEELALYSVNLLRHYNSPLWWIEENMWGRTVIDKAEELGYKNLGHEKTSKGIKKPNAGFHTGDTSRTDIFGKLIPAVNDQQIRIYNREGLEQFYHIIRNSRRDGFIEASSGHHDDYVMAVGIAWLKKNDVWTGEWSGEPVSTLTFRSRR